MSNKPLKRLIAGVAVAGALTGITYAATPAAAEPTQHSNPAVSLAHHVMHVADAGQGNQEEPEHD